VKYDPTFEKDMEVYYGQVTVRIRLAEGAAAEALPAGLAHTLAITSQGCADAGLCYPPETRELQLTRGAGGAWQVSGRGVVASVPAPLQVVLGGDGKPMGGTAPASGAAAEAGLHRFVVFDTRLATRLHDARWFRVIGL